MMLIKMAFFSLFTHKNKTLLILIILSLSACLTLLGFITYNTFEQNTRKSLTETVSGDILIHNSKQSADIDILESSRYINPIEDYTEVEEILNSNNAIEDYTPLCKSNVMLKDPKSGDYSTPIPVVGADIDEYMDIFKKMKLIEGKLIPEGKSGILISKSTIEQAVENVTKMMERMKSKEDSSDDDDKSKGDKQNKTDDNRNTENNSEQEQQKKDDNKEERMEEEVKEETEEENEPKADNKGNKVHTKPKDDKEEIEGEDESSEDFPEDIETMKQRVKDRFKVGNTIKVAGYTINRSMRIMELKIYGIVEMEGIENISLKNSLIDISTYQKLVGYDAESEIMTVEQMQKLEENRKYMLEFEVEDESSGKGAFDESSLESFFDDMVEEEDVQYGEDIEEENLTLDLEKYKQAEEDIITETSDKTGKTDFIIVRLNNPALIGETVKQLNSAFQEQGIDFKAISYLESSISLGSYISLARIIITMIIFLILVISIIIITNAILMSVIDRTSEIGTMMAIGAKRCFIFNLILGESIFISLITAFIGMIIGVIVILIISIVGVPANDTITMMLFGGEQLYPSINIASFIYTFVLVFAIAMVSTIYPLIFSTRLTPLQAMSKV